jgi:hypothetical protein
MEIKIYMISNELKKELDICCINNGRIIITPISSNSERNASVDYEREMQYLAQGQDIILKLIFIGLLLMNVNKSSHTSYNSLVLFIAVGLLVAGVILITWIFAYRTPAPKLPTIITVPSLPYKDRAQIDKDILFDKACKRFGECMADANKITAEACKTEFWDSGRNY